MSAEKRVALVTGANKGLGHEIARQLAGKGCVVFLGARGEGRAQQAAASLKAAGDVRGIEIDYARPETFKAAAEKIDREFGRLDILVNNAAIADLTDGPPSSTSPETVERTFATNVVGTLRSTQSMLPLLRKSAKASIVNMSSGLGSLTQNGDGGWKYSFAKFFGYAASKAALNMMTVQLAFELKGTNIAVNSADPGYTATDLNQNRGEQTVEEGAVEPVRLALLTDGTTGGYSDKNGPVPW